jgi:TPR repeat protein
MADDGGWPAGAGPESWESGDARTRAAIDQLRLTLDQAERRLVRDDPAAVEVGSLASLIQSLDDLARRVASQEVQSERHATVGVAALERIGQRLEAQAKADAAREAAMSARLDRMLDELERTRSEAATEGEFKETPGVRTLLGLVGGAAALGVVGTGAFWMLQPALAPPFVPAMLDHLGLRPGLRSVAATARPAAPSPAPAQPREIYAAVASALARGETGAVPRLVSLAEAGDAEAQLHLASLYEVGGGGLPQDLPAARAWTERAAQGGDRIAQHNLALFLMQGEGGVRDLTEAAFWFRKAAEQGVVDAQYNLGLLFESGRGVERNLSEAYRWFAVAANAGDTAALEKKLYVERQLMDTERAALGLSGAEGPGRGDELATLVIAPATTIAETQALLARQGYYKGPIDGAASPAFRAAADAYLRDRGIAR